MRIRALLGGPIQAAGYDSTAFADAIVLEGQHRGFTLHRAGDPRAHLHVSDRFDSRSRQLDISAKFWMFNIWRNFLTPPPVESFTSGPIGFQTYSLRDKCAANFSRNWTPSN